MDARVVPDGDPQRYIDLGLIARGGMGQVRRVHDRRLARSLAMKVMDWRFFDRPEARARFLAEVRISARLQHPGIVSAQDVGELPDGRLWFTMKEVVGRTLGAVVEAVHAASPAGRWGETVDGWSMRRLIEALLRVTQTVAYAHGEGIVHRDIKPDNLMIGPFGEVMVMDWGIARARAIAGSVDASERTTVVGTPSYMAPEQARGEAVTAAADVYALGGVLYFILAARAPLRTGGDPFAVLTAPPPRLPPALPAVDRAALSLPSALVALCHAALARAIADRPTVDGFAAGLRAWLDGEARRAEARALVTRARAIGPEINRLRVAAGVHDTRARALLDGQPRNAPIEARRPAWQAADAAVRDRRAAREAELTLVQTLRQALEADPESDAARAMLNAHYRARLFDAERRRDTEAAADAAAQLQLHDPAGNVEWLRGDGRLTLRTDPPGARVELYRIEQHDRRRIPIRVGDAGPTPLLDHPLARGSALLLLHVDGCAPVRYPVNIERGGSWQGAPPGRSEPAPVHLPPVDALGPDEVYVPAGWCVVGGDPGAADTLPRTRVWLDGFVIERHPTRNRDYLAFLDALVGAGQRQLALRCAPSGRTADGEGPYRLGPNGFESGRSMGFDWLPDRPVMRVTWHAARAYAAWRAERDGLPWRLPESLEWEKATRGVDERIFAMGDHLDPAFACIAESHDGQPMPAPVNAWPLDESIYGVRGMTGNVRTLCATAYRRAGAPIVDGRPIFEDPEPVTHRVVRGGAYLTRAGWCRAACRFAIPPGTAASNTGLRLVRSLGSEAG